MCRAQKTYWVRGSTSHPSHQRGLANERQRRVGLLLGLLLLHLPFIVRSDVTKECRLRSADWNVHQGFWVE